MNTQTFELTKEELEYIYNCIVHCESHPKYVVETSDIAKNLLEIINFKLKNIKQREIQMPRAINFSDPSFNISCT